MSTYHWHKPALEDMSDKVKRELDEDVTAPKAAVKLRKMEDFVAHDETISTISAISSKVTRKQGEAVFELGSKKKVTVSEFKGNVLVGIREFYTDKNTGEEKPGSKGIALTIDQFNKLRDHITEIDEAVNNLCKAGDKR